MVGVNSSVSKKRGSLKRRQNKRLVTVAVTGLNAIDSPGPGVAVIRAIRDCPEFIPRIIGLSYESLEPGIYMRDVVDKVYQIPYPSAGMETLLARLQYIHSKEKMEVIIPNFDSELYNFIKLSGKLAKLGIRTFLPTIEQFEAREKTNLSSFCRKYRLNTPKDIVIHKIEELKEASDMFGYPMVVKGKYYEATIAYSVEEAQKIFHKLVAKWGLPVIIQEFVTGIEINIAVLGDGKGNAISIIPMRKLYITDKGKAWAGITLKDRPLVALAEKFIRATKWKGAFELEIVRTKDEKIYILEINPRFPAWIYLTQAAGQNQPAALIKMALGETVKQSRTYDVGKIFVRCSWDLITDVSEFQKISAFGEYEPNHHNRYPPR